MGLYDRPYYQDEPSRSLAPLASRYTMVVTLIIINVVLYLIDVYIYRPDDPRLRLSYLLSVKPETLWRPWLWWQFLTYGFVHDWRVTHVLGNMLGLYFLGQPVESLYGRQKFLRIYLTSLLLCSIVWCVTQNVLAQANPKYNLASLVGASGAVTTIVILFALNYPRQTILFMMFIPMPAWVFGVLIVIMNLFGIEGGHPGESGTRIAFDVHLVGAAYGLLLFRTHWDLASLWRGDWRGWLRRPAQRPRLKLHDPDETAGTLDEQADAVLAKLHAQGEASLTARERKILEEYSRRLQQKRR